MRIAAGERGLTLVELMIALALLAVVLASVLAAFDSILFFSESASNVTVATLDARDVMQEVTGQEYEDLLDYAPTPRTNLRGETIAVRITDEAGTAIAGPLPDLVRIEVEVAWEERGSPVRTALATLRARGF